MNCKHFLDYFSASFFMPKQMSSHTTDPKLCWSSPVTFSELRIHIFWPHEQNYFNCRTFKLCRISFIASKGYEAQGYFSK